MLMFLQVFLHSFISILGVFIMKIRKSKSIALLWIVAILCVLIGVCGCDWEGLFEDIEDREWRKFHFEINVLVYSDLTGDVVRDTKVNFHALKRYHESEEDVPGTYKMVEREVYRGPVKWKFDYEILYDKEKKKYMEFVLVRIFAHYISPSGGVSGLSGRQDLRVYPSGGGWSSLKFSELSGSTMFDRKYMVRVPLRLRDRIY